MSIHIEHHPLYQATCAERDALKAELMNEKACHTMDLASRDTEIGMLKAELAAVKELSEHRLKSEQKHAWESLDIRAEIGTLKSLLGKERDEFGKKETELKAEISKLEAEVENIKRCPNCEVKEGEFHNEYCCLELWRSRAAKAEHTVQLYREALENLKHPHCLGGCDKVAQEALKDDVPDPEPTRCYTCGCFECICE